MASFLASSAYSFALTLSCSCSSAYWARNRIHIRTLQDVAATLGNEERFFGERFGFFVILLIVAQAGEVEEDIGFILNHIDFPTNIN